MNQDFYLPKLPLPPYGKTSIKCGNDSQTEAFFKHRVKILQQSIAENNDPIDYDTRNPFTKRRLKAIKRTMPEVVKRYSDRIPYTEGLGDLLEQTWVAMNAPQMSFNDIERCNNIVFAAAIWILDHVEIPKILPYLPTDDAFIEDYDGPMGVWDCKYDLDLIASVVHVIENRNGKPDRNDDGEAIHLINDELTALGKKTYEGTTRKQFEAIISLIPQKDLLFAAERWKSLFWQWTDTFFQNFEVNVMEIDGIVRDAFEMGVRSNAIVDAHNKLVKSIVTARAKSIKKQQKTIFDKPLQAAPITTPKLPFPAPGTHQFPAVSKTENILLNAFTTELGPDASKLTDYYKQWIEINKQIRTRAEKVKDFLEDVEDYRMNAVDYDSTIKFELHDEDLYGLCFATLYLADTDDDLAWLYGPGCAMMAQITDSLPWSMGFFMEEEEEIVPEEDLEPVEVKPVEMLDWYERKYASKEDPDARSLAQVMYENCGCIMPRDMHQFDYLAPEFKRYGIRGKTLEILLSCMSAVSTARSQNRAVNLFRWDDDGLEETAEEPSVATDALKDAKAEIKRLRTALHDAELASRTLSRQIEDQKLSTRRDQQELADLRELVYSNQQDGAQEEPKESGIDLPYTVQQNTIVFGGHDTWNKAIRPQLQGKIRFVDKDYVFDTGIIKNVDVIWIQPNALSHHMYYRIVDNARLLKKTVRYFSTASATICAEQLAKYDMELSEGNE